MLERIFAIIRKELNQLFRNRLRRLFLFVPPIFQLIIFGYAVNLDVDNLRMGWMDMDQSPQSHDLLADFQGSGRFLLTSLPQNEKGIQDALDRGDAQVIVRVLPGFGRDILLGRPTSAQILVDGTNSNTASLASAYTSQLVAAYSSSLATAQMQSRMMARAGMGTMSMRVGRISDSARVWFNPDLRSRNYFIPGVIVNIITIVTLSLTAMAIVREKEIGTMEQLMVTPVRASELIIGKTLPFVFVGIWDMLLVLAAALLVFHVPFQGNFWLLFGTTLLFLLTTLGAGLFISTVSRTQQQAMMATGLFFQPFFMLSGFTFPIRNMPQVAQWLTIVNPVRYFMEIVRGVFLQGAGVAALWPQMVALAIFGVTILWLSVLRFHKQLE
jgi:ABC-2 type transport system permease protein